MITLLLTFLFTLFILPAHAETLQWAGGGKNSGFLGVLHQGVRGNARNGDTIWMTGEYDRFVSRYIALDWEVKPDVPGPIKMDGSGGLCLDAGSSPKADQSLQVWDCSPSRGQEWIFSDNQLRLADTTLCVEINDSGVGDSNIRLAECKGSRFGQWWRLREESSSFTIQDL